MLMCFNLVFVIWGIKSMWEFMFLTSKQQVRNTTGLINITPHDSYISVRQFGVQKQLLQCVRDPVLGDLSWHFLQHFTDTPQYRSYALFGLGPLDFFMVSLSVLGTHDAGNSRSCQ